MRAEMERVVREDTEPGEGEGALQSPPSPFWPWAPAEPEILHRATKRLRVGAGLTEGNTFTGKPQIIFKALLYKHIKGL